MVARLSLAAAILIGLTGPASAGPYFRFEPLQSWKTSAVFGVTGSASSIAWGNETTVIRHHAEDGFLLIHGLSWDALDLGATKADRWRPLIGSSLDLSEPMKALILASFEQFAEPGETLYSFLAPSKPGEKSFSLNLGPGLSVDPGNWNRLRDVRGSLIFHAGLTAKVK